MSSENIYGVDLAMTPSGDLAVNAAGALATIGEVDVMAQALSNRLRTALGDLVLHPQYGINLPIGNKMDPMAVAAALNGELVQAVKEDPRIQQAQVNGVEYPVKNHSTAVMVTIACVLSSGVSFTTTGLPGAPRITEVSSEGQITAGADLTPFEQAPFFAEEPELETIEAENELDSIVSDLLG